MVRGTEILLAQEFTVRCVGLKEGEDPDSFLRRDGPDAFADRLNGSRPFFDHFLALALEKFDRTTVPGRTAIVDTLGGLIRATANVIEADEYVQRLAETLSLSADVVRAHLRLTGRGQKPPGPGKPPPLAAQSDETQGVAHPAEKALLRILVDHPALAGRFERFKLDWIEHAVIRQLVERALEASTSSPLDWPGMLESAEEREKQVLREIALMEEAIIGNPSLMLEEVCRRLEMRHRRKQARSLSKQLEGRNLASIEEMNDQLRQIQQHNQQGLRAREEIRRLREEGIG